MNRKRATRRTILAFLLLLGIGGTSFAQVPSHQERIRETAQDILARPEFGLFPRLGSLPAGSESGRWQTEGGMPRLQSSRGGQGNRGENGAANGEENAGRENGRARGVGPNGLPADAPDGRPRGNRNPENARDALGRDELLPEGGKLDRLLDDDNLAPNPNRALRPEVNNEQEQAQAQAPKPNGAAENVPAPRPDNENRARPPMANPAPADERAPAAKNARRGPDRIGNRQHALPAPRPRASNETESSRRPPSREIGGLARVVGTIFHVLAWTILAVICGLILWLIVKAIYEFERPRSLVPIDSGSGKALDLAPAQAPGDLPADVYLAHARRLAESGHYREAVVQLLLGAMSRVERAGWVRFRRGMTVRDYLRTIHQHPAAYRGFRAIVRVFEPLSFGRREPTPDHFEKSLQGYESGFGLD